MVSVYGTVRSGISSVEKVEHNIPTLLGDETVVGRYPSNHMIGPSTRSLLEFGAVYAPCIVARVSRLMRLTYRRLVPDVDRKIGCCRMGPPINTVTVTTQEECKYLSMNRAKWEMGTESCIEDSEEERSDGGVIKTKILRPCCYNLFGNCMMMSLKHCQFLEGTFHYDCDNCHQTNCMADVCKTWVSRHPLKQDRKEPWLVYKHASWQYYRILITLVMSPGLLHLMCLIVVEVTLMCTMEKSIGWHRIALIYVSSGITGTLAHMAFAPHSIMVASTGGIMGIVGAHILELFKAWNHLTHPIIDTIFITVISSLFFTFGFLPQYVSLVTVVTGLLSGTVFGVLMLPYIAFEGMSYWRGRIVVFSLIFWLSMFASLIHIAFKVVPLQMCPFCDI